MLDICLKKKSEWIIANDFWFFFFCHLYHFCLYKFTDRHCNHCFYVAELFIMNFVLVWWDFVFVFYCRVTNYLDCLTQHLFINSEYCGSEARLGYVTTVLQAELKSVAQAEFISRELWEKTYFQAILIVGRIHTCTVVGLRFLFICWMLPEGCL